MSFEYIISDMTKRVDKLLSKTAKISHKHAHNIDVQIKRGIVTIDAPKGTVINVTCWYDSCTKMSETFVTGSESHAQLIRKLDELEHTLSLLEKANA